MGSHPARRTRPRLPRMKPLAGRIGTDPLWSTHRAGEHSTLRAHYADGTAGRNYGAPTSDEPQGLSRLIGKHERPAARLSYKQMQSPRPSHLGRRKDRQLEFENRTVAAYSRSSDPPYALTSWTQYAFDTFVIIAPAWLHSFLPIVIPPRCPQRPPGRFSCRWRRLGLNRNS